jgi:hypothetical protein
VELPEPTVQCAAVSVALDAVVPDPVLLGFAVGVLVTAPAGLLPGPLRAPGPVVLDPVTPEPPRLALGEADVFGAVAAPLVPAAAAAPGAPMPGPVTPEPPRPTLGEAGVLVPVPAELVADPPEAPSPPVASPLLPRLPTLCT